MRSPYSGLLAAIVESSDDAIVSKDLTGIVTSWNQAAERLFGYTASEMVGASIYRIIPADRQQEEEYVLAQVRAGIGVDHFETIRRRKDGTHVEISLTVSPVRDDNGRIVGASKIARDITEQRRLRLALEQASRAKDEFLAMLGHELRNPLAPILTALHLMELRGVGAERERALIMRQVRHVVSLVDDLLDVSRITRGVVRLQKKRVFLADIVAAAIEMSSPILEQRRHLLSVSVPRDEELIVDADPDRLRQVLSNLLTNAAKYTDEGGHISVSASATDDAVRVRVCDNGIGIAPDGINRIFEIFTQGQLGSGVRPHGLGIGLAIVKNLVELHGGAVSASSAGIGAGAEFEVRLPRATNPAPDVERDIPPALGDPTSPMARVLIVDDNEDAATMLAESMTLYGYETRVAIDPPTALAVAPGFAPDIALLDIGLPGMDGYELARELRQMPELAEMRLIAVTGYGQQSDRERSRAHGFEAHLIKPVDPGELHLLISGATRAEP